MQADLWQKLGLERNPFPESGPDDVFLQTPAINQRLSLFAQLIRASDLTLLLLGESGIGKSTFLQRIGSTLGEEWRLVHWQARRGGSFDEVLHVMASGFAVTPGDIALQATPVELRQHIDSMRSSGIGALVVVDDADLLAEEVLHEILRLGTESALRVVLAGESPLADRIAQIAGDGGDAGLVHRIALTELNLAQTTDYVRARLHRAGWEDATPFNDQVCADIHQRSRGLPGAINQLASEFLTGPMPKEESKSVPAITPEVEEVKAKLTTFAPIQARITLHEGRRGPSKQMIGLIVAVVAVLSALGALGFWLLDDSGADVAKAQPDTPALIAQPAPQQETTYPNLTAAPPAPPPAVMANPEAPSPPGPVDLNQPTTPLLPQPSLPGTTVENSGQTAGSAESEEALPAPELAPPPPAPTTDEIAAAAAPAPVAPTGTYPRSRRAPWLRRGDNLAEAAHSTNVELRQPVVLAESTAPATAAPEATAPAVPIAPTTSPASVPIRVTVRQPARLGAEAAAATDSEATAPISEGGWLSRGNSARFTIQLVALKSGADADDFILENGLDDAYVVSLRTPDRKQVFAVVRGVFNQRDDAARVIARLPAVLRENNPWPRRIGSLLDAALDFRAPQP